MPHPKITTQRQHIRLWFEFYKLALDEPQLKRNLEMTRDFYEPWGDARGIDFRDWWKSHAYLFGVTRVQEITTVSKAPNVLNVAIPLNQAASKSITDVKDLIEEKQRLRLSELGHDTSQSKSLKSGFGRYEINAKELRGRPLHEAHVLYRIWLDLDKPNVDSAFVQTARERLLKRPKAKWLPSFLVREAEANRKGELGFTDDQIRQVRRSIKKAAEVCAAVSCGRFPN